MSSMKRELLLYCICRHLKILIEVEFSVTVGVAEVGKLRRNQLLQPWVILACCRGVVANGAEERLFKKKPPKCVKTHLLKIQEPSIQGGRWEKQANNNKSRCFLTLNAASW